ncbi:Uncharacterised protein [Mycobacterium tuberculosis]|nr:Uncharacterised protein [Mycobacterium tuberculosis]CNN25253.1 Uncharacterised protein [Mycobacterium tuberculosis]CNX30007.1 Uncharacterised protein [Mycobacterium tuberculosis]CNX98253.1 Uncharacterised protein [Mycobacterium tuberculosis]CNZ08493.1 Uncharacterised protein [Mycobacterium tuberculosis]
MELRQGPVGLHVRDPAGRDHHSPDPRRWGPQGRAGAHLVVARNGGGRPGTGGSAGPHRGAGRRPSDLGGRLRVRQVRADHVGHQRHRLPRPAALGRGGRLPGGPHRRAAYGGQLCRFGIGSGGAAGGIRARRRVADRVSAVTQGRSQTPRPGVHDRPLCHWWPAQNVGPADQNRSWWRTRGAGRSGHRCSGRPAGHPGRGHHGRGALGHGTGRIVGGRSAGRYDRRPFGVGAAAGGGTRSAGSRSVAHAVTRWPPAGRRGRPRAGVCGVAYRRIACRGWTGRRRHPGRRCRRDVGCAAGRGYRTRGLRRPGRRAGRVGRHRFRGQPGAATQCGHRTRRRGVPGRADDPESRRVRQLGGSLPYIRTRAARQHTASWPVGSPGAGRVGRRHGCPSGRAHRGGGPRGAGRARYLGRQTRCRSPHRGHRADPTRSW